LDDALDEKLFSVAPLWT